MADITLARPIVRRRRNISTVHLHFPTLGVIAWRIRKVANTSFGQTLSEWARHRPKAQLLPMNAVSNATVLQLLAEGSCTRVVGLCRHPLARLVSGFHKPAFCQTYKFERFVQVVAGTPDDVIDPHARSQTWELPDCAQMFPLEEIEVSWPKVRQVFVDCVGPISDADLPHVMPRKNESEHAPWETFYTPELRALAEARYAADFARLGYERTT